MIQPRRTINHTKKTSIKWPFVLIMCLLSLFGPLYAADGMRITTSLEIRHVQPMLRRIASALQGGFQRAEADRVAAEIRTMPANQPTSWSFTVRYHGSDHPLQVRALLDELGTVDLDFATSAELAPALRTNVDAYLNAYNL